MSHPDEDVDVRNLIQDLPQRMRNAFLLHYYAGFGVREVATLLGRPEGTIKADLFQARNPAQGHHGGIRWMSNEDPRTSTAGCRRGSIHCRRRRGRST